MLGKIKQPMKIVVVDLIYELCIKIMIFGVIFNFSHANNSLNTFSCKISKKSVYIDINELEKKCKQFIPKTYVYICDISSAGKRLIFIKDNHVIQSIDIHETSLFDRTPIIDIENIRDYNRTKNIITHKRRGAYWIKNLDIYLLSKRFDFLDGFRYTDADIKTVEINEKYGYLSAIRVIGNRNKVNWVADHRWKYFALYSYGLLLLPDDIEYTKKVTEKILDKYEQAWECTSKKLWGKNRKKNDKKNTNLTMLEKFAGKEKLECLDKYLVWDTNVSK